MSGGSSVESKIYASAFTSLKENNSNFIVQIPKKVSLEKVRVLLNDMTTEVGLSKEILQSTIIETFYEHVFARKTSPDDLKLSVYATKEDCQTQGQTILYKWRKFKLI